jgi:membrane protease YdiL (CAAX protease family)
MNLPGILAERRMQGRLAWFWPLVMLTIRFPLVLASHGLVALVLLLLGREDPWQAANDIWQLGFPIVVSGGSLLFLSAAVRKEGLKLRDLLGGEGRSWKQDILPGLGLSIPLGISIVVGRVIATIVVYGSPDNLPEAPPALPLPIAIWAILVFPVVVAVVEELVFRGYALPRLEVLTGNRWAAAFIMALGFGLHHTILPVIDFRHAAAFMIAVLPPALFYSWIYFRSRRLMPLIVAHWLIGIGSQITLLFLPDLPV